MERVRRFIHCEIPMSEGLTGKRSTVVIFDTGLAMHPDFSGRVVSFRDFVHDQTAAYDDNGHGTHLAGIIGGSGEASGGRYMGVAPDINYVICKVLDHFGNGQIETVLRAVDWVIKNRQKYQINLLNISIGMLPKVDNRDQLEFVHALQHLWDLGIFIVAAAGNNGPGVSTVTVPGTIPELLTVGSIDDEDSVLSGGMRSGYSGRGPTKSCITKPEVLAPGTQLISTSHRKSGYTAKSGTSMATAVVTGGMAVLSDAYELPPKELKLLLYSKLKRVRGRTDWGNFDFKSLLS